jgi:hypothetical protein
VVDNRLSSAPESERFQSWCIHYTMSRFAIHLTPATCRPEASHTNCKVFRHGFREASHPEDGKGAEYRARFRMAHSCGIEIGDSGYSNTLSLIPFSVTLICGPFSPDLRSSAPICGNELPRLPEHIQKHLFRQLAGKRVLQ